MGVKRRSLALIMTVAMLSGSISSGVCAADVSAGTEPVTESEAECYENGTALTEDNKSTFSKPNIENDQKEIIDEAVYEGDGFRVISQLIELWGTGFTISVKIENTGDTDIHNWFLSYDNMYDMSCISNGQIYLLEDICIIKNDVWNQDIPVGGSAVYCFSAKGSFKGFPSEYELLGKSKQTTTDKYKIDYEVCADWNSGFAGKMIITNTSDRTIEDWKLSFQYANNIEAIWNAQIASHEGCNYVVNNNGYNQNIAPDASVEIGFIVSELKSCAAMKDIALTCRTVDERVDLDDVRISLNTSDMKRVDGDTENGEFYILSDKKTTLSGTAKNILKVRNFTYTLSDMNGIIKSGEIGRFENWQIDSIGFGTGYNLLTLSGKSGDTVVEEKYIILNTNLDNLKNLNVDLKVDSDQDKIPDYFETKFGLDKNSKDTDGDGLDDYMEMLIPNISPLSPDGDGNGILDVDEDYDGDGLSNYDEEKIFLPILA